MIQLLTAADAAEMLVCSPETMLRLSRQGKLVSVQIGERLVRFTPEAVEQFIKRAGGDDYTASPRIHPVRGLFGVKIG